MIYIYNSPCSLFKGCVVPFLFQNKFYFNCFWHPGKQCKKGNIRILIPNMSVYKKCPSKGMFSPHVTVPGLMGIPTVSDQWLVISKTYQNTEYFENWTECHWQRVVCVTVKGLRRIKSVNMWNGHFQFSKWPV